MYGTKFSVSQKTVCGLPLSYHSLIALNHKQNYTIGKHCHGLVILQEGIFGFVIYINSFDFCLSRFLSQL